MRVTLSLVLALVACSKKSESPPRPTGPVEVGVVTIQPQEVTLRKELPGRTSALRVAEVRARVNGIVQKRLFDEGSDVKQGQALFRIDPAPYQAVLESAQAQVARADAAIAQTRSLAERYQKLIETNAVSKQEVDDANAKVKTAEADLAAARAAVKRAAIDVSYTNVTAPLAGRIGRAEVTEGAYVQAQGATLLATIQQLDQVYVDITWSNTEAMRLRRAIDGWLSPHTARMRSVLDAHASGIAQPLDPDACARRLCRTLRDGLEAESVSVFLAAGRSWRLVDAHGGRAPLSAATAESAARLLGTAALVHLADEERHLSLACVSLRALGVEVVARLASGADALGVVLVAAIIALGG